MVLKIGSALGGRYEIISRIGSGGMSDVYKARDAKLNRFVAIKVLKDDYASDQTFVAKFRMEAQSAACLSNPNIVNIYDVGDEMGIYYIVMELIEGITLKRYIERKGKLGVREAIEVAMQVSHGLIAAHAEKIVHRDIKPQNIMISKEGKVKVTDFGIARAASTKTISSSTMGSVHYISPEQARGGFCDERSDIYSLGIMLYEMLTGKVPFEGETSVAVALQHIQGEMVPPREYEPAIPKGLEKIILKCTRKRPEARYASAALLLEDFKRVLSSPDGDIDVDDDNGPAIITYGSAGAAAAAAGAVRKEESAAEAVSSERMKEARYQMGEDGDENADGETDSVPLDVTGSEKAEDDKERRFEKIVTYAGIVVAVLVVAVVAIIALNMAGVLDFGGGGTSASATDATVEIMDLRGKTYEEANELLSAKGITVKASYDQDSSYPEGTIFFQDIDPGTVIDSPNVINVVINVGDSSLVIPSDVQGLEPQTVRQQLTQLGFTNINPTYYEEYSESISAGKVVRIDPPEGSEVTSDAAITIVISKGPAAVTVTVPDVKGMSESSARSAITDRKLVVGVVSEEYSTSVEKGRVIRQSPESGSSLSEGASVNIVISRGQEGVKVPELGGLTLDEAVRKLQDAGLLLGDMDEEFDDDHDEGTVCGQSPSSGSPVARNTKVNVVISLGSEPASSEPTQPDEPSSDQTEPSQPETTSQENPSSEAASSESGEGNDQGEGGT
ncbi:MAG: Stk1 family PASTA domain-containing Ser/Thr kinase [Lachnospiraceae bacterium]|nr:Stk1 family PASTA domain-containing Ser/Thr kinase [Lachnospiraceae bacterium]